MFNRVKKVKDFDKFVEELRNGNPSHIVVEATREPARKFGMLLSSFTFVGQLGQWEHALLYTVSFGRKTRRYWQPLFSAFQSEYGFADTLERNKRVMSVLLAGEKKVEYLREQFPGTDIYLGNGQGEPFTPDTLDKLHEQSKEYGVAAAI